MDRESFDQIARRLAGHVSRRDGLKALLGALAGFGTTTGAATRDTDAAPNQRGKRLSPDRQRPGAEGPCKTTKRPDNTCTKNKQCCTNICNTKAGKKNRDGVGRCRCIRRGGPCTETRNCCTRRNQQMTCDDGFCGGKPGPTPAGIPTGDPCVEGDACLDPAATCTTYCQSATNGTFCLLPIGASCAADTDCRAETCASGACAAQVCDVCASGCQYSTVQAALDAPPTTGQVIRIGAGTYSEDLVAPSVEFTLTNCNCGDVTLKNASDNTRTLVLGSSSDTAPHPTVTIRNITITGKGTPVAGDTTPVAPSVGDGGIMAYTDLVLEGTAKVTGCNWISYPYGGGISSKPQDAPLFVTLRGSAEVSNNFSISDGGGIWNDSYTDAGVILEGNALVTGNYAVGKGAGVYTGYENIFRMSGSATISYNRAEDDGAGAYVYAYNPASTPAILSEQASIVFNSHTGIYLRYGGGIYVGQAYGDWVLEMRDSVVISDNTTIESGGGIGIGEATGKVLMEGSVLVTRNTATTSAGGIFQGELDIRDSAQVISNTPDDCSGGSYAAGSKTCGV